MKNIIIAIFVCLWLAVLSSACNPTVQTVEVTKLVPQTVMATQLVTQLVPVDVPQPPSRLRLLLNQQPHRIQLR